MSFCLTFGKNEVKESADTNSIGHSDEHRFQFLADETHLLVLTRTIELLDKEQG